MKKITEQIRQAKTWRERAAIASGEKTETLFDEIIGAARTARKSCSLEYARELHCRIGSAIAALICAGEVQKLHSLADTVSERKKVKPDYILETLFNMSGLFPSGWTKRWVTDINPKTGRPTKRGVAGVRDTIAIRDLLGNLKTIDPNFDKKKVGSYRKKLQRYAKKLGIPLDDSPGRP